MPVVHKSGDRVVITKLMLKLQTTSEPNYKIAAAADMHPTTLSLYARGKQEISPKHMISLCKLFECEPEELIGNVTVEIE